MGTVVYLRPYRSEYQSPISAMNITPLIDVMLVLLVMLILCLPMAMHQVTVDLPTGIGPTVDREPVVQKLVLDNQGIAYWNGTAMDDSALAKELRMAAAAKDDLQFQTEANARYDRFNHLIGLVKDAGVTKLGFVGNNKFAEWQSK